MVEAHAGAPVLDPTALSASLEKLFRERRTPPLIPGSQLAGLINEAIGGGWSYRDYFQPHETPNLRRFVQAHVTDEVVRLTDQRRGTDFMYAVPQKASAVELAHEGKLWKSFVAVHPQADSLVYSPETAAISVLSANLPVPADCVHIAPVSLAEHRALCLEFCARIEGDGAGAEAAALRTTLEQGGEAFYHSWLKTLRARKPLDREWGQFRHSALLALFEQRLLSAGAPAERAAQLKQEISLDHEVARAPKQIEQAVVASEALAGPTTSRDSRERRARELLRAAADRLSYEQLMLIQLPMAVVLELTSAQPHEK